MSGLVRRCHVMFRSGNMLNRHVRHDKLYDMTACAKQQGFLYLYRALATLRVNCRDSKASSLGFLHPLAHLAVRSALLANCMEGTCLAVCMLPKLQFDERSCFLLEFFLIYDIHQSPELVS